MGDPVGDVGAGRRRRWLALLGASAVVVAGIAIVDHGRRDAPADAAAVVQRSTRIGERRTIRLSDGTRVELNVGSTLRYPSSFTGGQRAVTLVGEAFFVIANDSLRPFSVSAGPAVIDAAGGAFDVRAYPDAGTAQVVVDSGTARVHRAGSPGDASPTIVTARGIARVARDGSITLGAVADLGRYLGWRTGRIVLTDVPLRGALAEISRWQRVELRIGDSVVANRRVTATFASHQTLTEILDGIALQAGAQYDRMGRTITFRRER
jgi:ferric-dicitrate binding protein FerR (iron transport regulator)